MVSIAVKHDRYYREHKILVGQIILDSETAANALAKDLQSFFATGGTAWQSLTVFLDVERVYATRADCIRCPQADVLVG